MKKLIFLLAILASGVIAIAQDFNIIDYKVYTGTASDTCNNLAGVAYITVKVDCPAPYFYAAEVLLNETSGSASGYCEIAGSLDNINYNLVDTMQTIGTATEAQTADGYVYLADLTTGVAWKYLRFKLYISTTGGWEFDRISLRVMKKP
jgi:hypothetical protein